MLFNYSLLAFTCLPATGYEIYQLEDPFNVNKRRAEVGLGPIEEYIEHWGIKFEPEKMQRP